MMWRYERNLLCRDRMDGHKCIGVWWCWVGFVLVVFGFCFVRPVAAVPPGFSTDVVGGVEIKQLPVLSSMRNYHGYMEYRFALTNTLAAQSRHVRLGILGRHQRDHHIRDTSRAVVVGPQSRVELSLYIPALNLSASQVDIQVDHGAFSSVISLQHGYRYHYTHSQKEVSVLADPKAAVNSLVCDTLLREEASVNVGKKMYQRVKYVCSSSDVPMPQWSDSWLAYSRFDGVIVTREEWVSVATNIRNALERYVGNGGTLVILGDYTAPKHWISGQSVSRSPLRYHLGFGKILVHPRASMMTEITKTQGQIIADETYRSFLPWQTTVDPMRANALFPVVDDVRVPTRGIFVLMLVFCLLVGPLNLRWLRRNHNRILMLVTVPVASLFTCVLIFGYAILTEGWSGHVRTSTVTVFDQRTHQAYSLGWKAFYFPLTPKDGIHLSYDTELTPQFLVQSWRQVGRGFGMTWDNDQHLSSGWVVSRLPIHITFRRVQTRRERLVIKRQSPQTLEVTNGMGAKILNLWVADAQGKVYHSSTVLQAGARQILSLSSGFSAANDMGSGYGGIRKIRNMMGKGWLDLRRVLITSPEKFLQKNTYIAEMESSPFVELGARQSVSQRHESVVFGILKGNEHGS